MYMLSIVCVWVCVCLLPYSQCEQVRGKQWGDEDHEDVGGEQASLHHLTLPYTQGAWLLLRVLEHKLPGGVREMGGRETREMKKERDLERSREMGT